MVLGETAAVGGLVVSVSQDSQWWGKEEVTGGEMEITILFSQS